MLQGEGKRKGTTQVKCKGMKKSEMHIVSYDDGAEVMRDQGNWESCSARRGNSQIGVWENLANLNQAMQTKFFIESPPLASIFAECEWMDWISEEYPNKHRTGREWELRIEVAKKKKLRKHVCGDVPEAAHYVDAVTTEKRIPWYELKTGTGKHEVYKLSPFHGYLCSDSNMPNQPEYCQDMKVDALMICKECTKLKYKQKLGMTITLEQIVLTHRCGTAVSKACELNGPSGKNGQNAPPLAVEGWDYCNFSSNCYFDCHTYKRER